MESLIPFLKHSSALDLLVTLLVTFITVILIPGGIWIVIASRRRKPIYFFLMIAVLPLLLALLGTYLRFRGIERALSMFPEASNDIVASARQEAWITTYIGAAGTAVLGLIGLTGLVLKKEGKT
jgi:hypothetical protein